MNNSTSKLKTQKIVLKAKDRKRTKAVMKAWVDSSDKTDSDPFDLNDAPTWAVDALAEVIKIVLPGKRLPTSGEWDLELIGEFLGRLQAFGALLRGEIPLSAEMSADSDRLKRLGASLQPRQAKRNVLEKSLAADLQVKVAAVNQAIPEFMAAALGSSHEDTVKFQRGLQRGMILNPEDLDWTKIVRSHTRIFWILGLQWRRFYGCRSVAEVHRKLSAEFGEQKVCSLKVFENRIATKIGMKFRNRGRPAKLN